METVVFEASWLTPGVRRIIVGGDALDGFAPEFADGYVKCRSGDRMKPGDTLEIKGPGGAYTPSPDADWHLLAGDEAVIPAIAVARWSECLPACRHWS